MEGDFCRAWVSTDADEQDLKAELGNASGLCFPNVTGSTALSCTGEGGAGGMGAGGAGGEGDEPGAAGASGATVQ